MVQGPVEVPGLQSQILSFCQGNIHIFVAPARGTAQDGKGSQTLAQEHAMLIVALSGFKIVMLVKSLPKRMPGINCHLIIATRW